MPSNEQRNKWFRKDRPMRLLDTQVHRVFESWFDRQLPELSRRSQNVIRGNIKAQEDFERVFLESEDLFGTICNWRNAGRKSAAEICAWWFQLSPSYPQSLAELTQAQKSMDAQATGGTDLRGTVAMNTMTELSVRSRNALMSRLASPSEVLKFLFLNPNLEEDLYQIRSLGKKSISEILNWVDQINQTVPHEAIEDPSSEGAAVTAFQEHVIQSIHGLGIQVPLHALNTSSLYVGPKGEVSPERGWVDFIEDWYRQALLGWNLPASSGVDHVLEAAVAEDQFKLAPVEKLGLWMLMIEEWVRHSFSRENGQTDALSWLMRLGPLSSQARSLLAWWLAETEQLTLEQMGLAFGITCERVRQIVKQRNGRLLKLKSEGEGLLGGLSFYHSTVGFVEKSSDGHWVARPLNSAWFVRGLAFHRGTWIGEHWFSEALMNEAGAGLAEQVSLSGVLDKMDQIVFIARYFEGLIAPAAVLEGIQTVAKPLIRPTHLLRKRIVQFVAQAGKACSLNEISEGIQLASDSSRVHVQITRLMAKGELISLGKRGLYMLPIEGMDGRSLSYDEWVLQLLKSMGENLTSYWHALMAYNEATGAPTDFRNFQTSMSLALGKEGRGELVPMPFNHVGLSNSPEVNRINRLRYNGPLITANLNHLPVELPQPGSKRQSDLAMELYRKLREPKEIIVLAMTHRFWQAKFGGEHGG